MVCGLFMGTLAKDSNRITLLAGSRLRKPTISNETTYDHIYP